MKLSIIVPVYNVENYVGVLLESLVKQTYKDKEIILVNDGSTDSSGEICDRYARNYPIVRVIHTENQGVQKARNTGLDYADGGYIALADSDDAIDLDCYELLINELEKTNSDISCCGYVNEFANNMHIKSRQSARPEPYVFDGREACMLSISAKEHGTLGFMWNKIYKRELLDHVRFRPEIDMCDDLFFTYEVINNAKRICFVNLPMYHYRYLPYSTSKTKRTDKYMHGLWGLEKLNGWLEENAPFCRKEVIPNYIFWNTKTCESMLGSFDAAVYEKVRQNIQENSSYIPYCSRRIRILANALLKSWPLYSFYGWTFWYMKKVYIWTKRNLAR